MEKYQNSSTENGQNVHQLLRNIVDKKLDSKKEKMVNIINEAIRDYTKSELAKQTMTCGEFIYGRMRGAIKEMINEERTAVLEGVIALGQKHFAVK